jgi:hypothetical protein
MNASMLALLLGFTSFADPVAPSWQADYGVARKQAVSANRPLVVFIGPGAKGWDKVSTEGALSAEVNQLLAMRYVALYVDTDTPEGKKLAADFGVNRPSGLIISTRTGDVQAFFHEGTLQNRDLLRYLVRFADPNRVIRGTEVHR